jgi:outer membrane immunogenic protein
MWTGFHVGLNAGGTWANNTTSNASTWIAYQGAGSADNYTTAILSGNQSSSSPAGFIGGGQIGYDWQVPFRGMGFVTGVEADIQGNANLSWLGTVRGRLGYLVTPNLLVYGTGGLAYGGYTANLQLTQNWGDLATSNLNFFNYGKSSYSNTMVGWTAGGGLEWMAMSNWSLKVEYLYYDLGNMSGSLANMAYGQNSATGTNALESITNYSKRINGDLVRAGVNYHFNLVTAPVVAKY